MRDDLAKLMSKSSCDECNGSRLNKESRNVYINKTPIYEITNLRISDALAFMKNMKLTGSKAKIAERVLKEIVQRLSFLSDILRFVIS